MNPDELVTLLILVTATSFTPGPNTTLSTALAANFGLRRALRFVFAVPVGWGMLLLACAWGVGALLLAFPLLRGAIVIGGAAYLLWLAARLARSAQIGQARSEQLQVGFVQGVALQFVNIKAWMLALAIVAGWIAGQADAQQRFIAVLPVLLAFAFFSNLSYALVGSLLRGWLAGPVVNGQPTGARLRVFNRLMALALVLTAGWMALGGAGLNGRPA